MIGLPIPLIEPGIAPIIDDVQVAVKLMIMLPPSLPAMNDTDPIPLPPIPMTIVGAPGTVMGGAIIGTNEFDGADAGPSPISLVGVTVHVYISPSVKPLTFADMPVVADEADMAPIADVVHETVYDTIMLPPVSPGMNETDAIPSPAMAITIVGWPGTAVGASAPAGCAIAMAPRPPIGNAINTANVAVETRPRHTGCMGTPNIEVLRGVDPPLAVRCVSETRSGYGPHAAAVRFGSAGRVHRTSDSGSLPGEPPAGRPWA